MTTPEHWAQIHGAFSAAREHEPGDRDEYLAATFGGDAALREAVIRLLRDAREADAAGFLKEPPWVLEDVPLMLPDFKNGDSDFSAIEYIGQGGMGVVYKAYDRNFGRWVALKFSSPSRLIGAAGVERFRSEAQSMARLRHPNIVTVHETGEYQGHLYFVMDLIEGAPLDERDLVERPREAAALLATVAMAVHHAHQRRILHNDPKPANILLDGEGRPHITDFGLARQFGEDAAPSGLGVIAGTASYMSPEQAEGRELTTTSDVYGLGAILYALLTGRAPFRGGTAAESLALVRSATPTPPRALNSRVDAELEAICLKCLRKPRAARYVSASALAHDLERYLGGIETVARPWTRRERVVAWCRRNTAEAAFLTGVVAVWVFSLVMALSVAQAQRAHLRQAAVDGVTFAAQDLAQTALLQLRHLGRNIEIATADGTLAESLRWDDRPRLERVVTDLCSDRTIPFATCYVLNRDGVMVAHAPRADHMIGGDLSWRDHFRGARAKAVAPAEGVIHVSRVYRGRSDKFAVSAPIMDRRGSFLGTIATSVTTGASMGPVFLHDDKRKVAMVAPADINHPDEPRANRHLILYHPSYRKGIDPVEFPSTLPVPVIATAGQGAPLTDPTLAVVHDDAYRDPVAAVTPEYRGRWIAGFAPVGSTGFLVVVQQRFEEAVSLEGSTLWSLALWSTLASLVTVAMLLTVLWRWARGRRHTAPPTGGSGEDAARADGILYR
jgi:eukaryotic-like serine/threonine-protein kinase